jgi:hypothetical protein
MRFIEMDPGEPGLLLAGDPFDGRRDRGGPGPFGLAERAPFGALAVAIVVDVEAARETEAQIEAKDEVVFAPEEVQRYR